MIIYNQYEKYLQKIITLSDDLAKYQKLFDELVKQKVPASEIKTFVKDICEFIDKKVDFSKVERDDLEIQRPGLIFILLEYFYDLVKGSFKMQENLAKIRNLDSSISKLRHKKY